MKYSIIVPVYNVERYLRECIDSILNQKEKDYELILIDDGSTDNCNKICDEYAIADSRIVVIHKKNGGVSDARNRGLEIARGDYILFVDPDDYVEPQYLNTIDSKIADYDMLFFSHYKKYRNKTVKCFGEDNVLTRAETQNVLLSDSKYCGYLWNKVFKNEIIKNNKLCFENDVSMCEDLLFVFQYIKNIQSVKTIDEPLINYRQRKSSIISMPVKLIDSNHLFKTYHYCIDNAETDEAKIRSKALYLKTYYKYKKSIKKEYDSSLVKSILENDYKKMTDRDRKVINMYKYAPELRTIIYGVKDLLEKKYA